LHPTKNFPYVSLLFLGAIAFIFSITIKNISDVVHAILAMRILTQFIAQAAGLLLLNKRRGRGVLPWKMFLYPLPVIAAIIIWFALFCFTGRPLVIDALLFIATGIVVYFIKEALAPSPQVTERDTTKGQ